MQPPYSASDIKQIQKRDPHFAPWLAYEIDPSDLRELEKIAPDRRIRKSVIETMRLYATLTREAIIELGFPVAPSILQQLSRFLFNGTTAWVTQSGC